MRISSTALRKLLAHVAAEPAREVCGLLLGIENHVAEARACANIAPDPARAFEIDPAALIAAHRAARGGGPAIIGHYHSHPGGSVFPSARDAAASARDGAVWLIVAGAGFAAWRAEPDGGFARIDVMEAQGGCANPIASPEGGDS